MIDRTLNALLWDQRGSRAGKCEMFAVTYLSRYNDAAISARTNTSMRRAFNMETLDVVGRIANGRPGYAIATWPTLGTPRIVVAIEGTTALSQLFSLTAGGDAASATPARGHVYTWFNTYAIQIQGELMANATFRATFNRPGAAVAFTGFSLGSAIAQVLHARFSRAQNTKQYCSFGFATPRIGSGVFHIADNYRGEIGHCYCETDPIDTIPIVTTNLDNWLQDPAMRPFVNFAANPNPERFDVLGQRRNARWDGSLEFLPFCNAFLRNPAIENNPFVAHSADYYRYMMTSLANAADATTFNRFAYLEYNDDNSWGQRWASARGNVGYCKFNATPAPADVVAAVDQIEAAVAVRRPAAAIIPQRPMVPNAPAVDGQPRPQGAWVPRRTRPR